MVTTPELEVLKKSALSKDLSEYECEVLAGLIELRSLKDGEIVCGEGQSDSRLHGVVSGALGVSRRDPASGEWQNLHVITVGDLAGELSFIDGTPHYSALRALGDTNIYSLERTRLEALLETQPRIVYQVMRAIMRVVHTIQRRLSMQAAELTNYIYKQHGRY
jgi:CRP-like cAMP-binding protein